MIAESDASGNVIREYVWLNDMPVAQFEASGTTYYIHADQLGTPQKMTNASKAVVWDRQWLPFGEDHLLTGTATNPLRFPGQYADDEVKLNYNYFRDYDSSVGRYIEVDPIGLDGGLNVFGYAEQNPILFDDQYGLISTSTCLKACTAEYFDNAYPGVQAGVAVTGAPIPKSAVGARVVLGASKNFNSLSAAEYLAIKKGLLTPRLPIRILKTTRLCGVIGRASGPIAIGLAIFDASAISSCTVGCSLGR